MQALESESFLPAWLYTEPDVHRWDCSTYAGTYWHPVTATSQLAPGQCQAINLLGRPLLLTRPGDGEPRAFLNRCPHRGVAFQDESDNGLPCRRLICPYHGWTYNLEGELLAAAREQDLPQPFQRRDWPLTALPCLVDGPLIWVALSDEPRPLTRQLEQVHQDVMALWTSPMKQVHQIRRRLTCNWKVAHDNTLDDYHVAVAHPTTLHREQGPVKDYVHRFTEFGNVLITPHADGGHFHTFGLPPWTHLITWPDGRLALLEFLPESHCTTAMQLRLFVSEQSRDGGDDDQRDQATDIWLTSLLGFLEEDRKLVESAQRGYESGITPGPAHRLEDRILHWQRIYRQQLPGATDASSSEARRSWQR